MKRIAVASSEGFDHVGTRHATPKRIEHRTARPVLAGASHDDTRPSSDTGPSSSNRKASCSKHIERA